MGVPVAKTRGMKTGAPGHSISRLRAQATRRGGPQQGPFGAPHPRARRSPLSAMSVPLSRSLPQDRQCACRRARHADASSPHHIHAADQPEGCDRQRSAITQSRTALARGLRREAGPPFFSNVACDLQRRHAQRAPQAWWNAQPHGGTSRTGRLGRAQRPPPRRPGNVRPLPARFPPAAEGCADTQPRAAHGPQR